MDSSNPLGVPKYVERIKNKEECPGCKIPGCNLPLCNGIRKCVACFYPIEARNPRDICYECALSDMEHHIRNITASLHPCHICNREKGRYMCSGCYLPTCGWTSCGRYGMCAECKVDPSDMCKKEGCERRRIQADVNPLLMKRRPRKHPYCDRHGCRGLGVRHDLCENFAPFGSDCDECRKAPPMPYVRK